MLNVVGTTQSTVPRDPAFAAVARVLDAEKAFTAAVAVKDYSRDVGLDEARVYPDSINFGLLNLQ
jgi:hypothetical protein